LDLTTEQQQLLVTLVEAWRTLAKERRSKFLVVPFDGTGSHCFIRLPGRDQFEANPYEGDVDTLKERGLLRADYVGGKLRWLDLTPRAFVAYDVIKAREGGPAERRELHIRRWLDDASARRRYPATFAKLDEADKLLWADFNEESLTTIGHKCREAMQAFAEAAAAQCGVSETDLDRTKTKNRIRHVLGSLGERVGESEVALLDALQDYWSALNAAVQRQEHGSEIPERPLSWDDARRVVFHTTLAVLEIDRTIVRARVQR